MKLSAAVFFPSFLSLLRYFVKIVEKIKRQSRDKNLIWRKNIWKIQQYKNLHSNISIPT